MLAAVLTGQPKRCQLKRRRRQTAKPAATMQNSVQITFALEIAAMQLTPSFKMDVLKVRSTSKLVSMRLGSSQQPEPAMNLQVAFEIADIQPADGALGTIRLSPSQQAKPTATGSPSFAVAGLQVMPNIDTAPVQLAPLQGAATVFVTAACQISTIEFSPSFEIASIILNSNSKQVIVQLPGAAPDSADSAPAFEIANLQVSDSGDNIGMMQLNLVGTEPKRG
jgi:hypothetical protein